MFQYSRVKNTVYKWSLLYMQERPFLSLVTIKMRRECVEFVKNAGIIEPLCRHYYMRKR